MSVPSLFTTSKIVLCREYTLLPFCEYIYLNDNVTPKFQYHIAELDMIARKNPLGKSYTRLSKQMRQVQGRGGRDATFGASHSVTTPVVDH